MSPSLDGGPDSDDLDGKNPEIPEPPDLSALDAEGCVPTGWLWPTPIPACGTAAYWTPNTVTVDQVGEEYNVNARTQLGTLIVSYPGFENRDNAEAYKTYLSTCKKPRCDGGSGGSGVMRNGIKILNVIDTRAKAFTMSDQDFSRYVPNFRHDDNGAAKRTEEGGITFWRFESRDASGGSINRTNRPEWNTDSGTRSRISEARSMGTIGAADDPRDIEVTYIVRVHEINDSNANWLLKTRGNGHSGVTNENTLTMSFCYPYSKRKDSLYGVEISHPTTTYRNVNIRNPDYLLPGPDKWIGIKNVIYNINNNTGIHCDCYVDEDPIIPGTGTFRNNWEKVWDYEETRSDTPVWAGPAIQLIADQVEQQDVAAFEVVGIIAPKAIAAMSTILPLNTDQSHSNEFTVEDGDIIYD